jgi:hypothetical protein
MVSGFFTSHHAGEPDNGGFPAIVVRPIDDEFDVLGLVIAAPDVCPLTLEMECPILCPLVLRVVRCLPLGADVLMRDDAARAGVVQAPREETAACSGAVPKG